MGRNRRFMVLGYFTLTLPPAIAGQQPWCPLSPPRRPEWAVAPGVLALAPSRQALPPLIEPALGAVTTRGRGLCC
jgi:hypothetical protein